VLSAFVVAQLVFDVAVVAFAAVYLLTRRAPREAELPPPEWYGHFLKVAQDLMAATEPVLERLETRAPAAVTPPPVAAPPDPYAEARRLLRAGASADEFAAREGLQPAELRLLARIVAAESRRPSA
jgi:hypothetical protein